jgi:predicted acylesterase/phospholipase RssA
MKNYECIVLGGGGAKGIAAVGALYYMYERGWLKNVKTYSGCSIGSIVCALMCVGYSPLEIFAKISEFNHIPELNFTELFLKMGLVDIKKITLFVEDLLDVKASRDITFQELKDFYEKELFIVATKYSTKTPVYFSHKTSPNMKIIDAINMSCNIPFIFTSYEYEGDIYFDGGLCDNLPISVIPKDFPGALLVIMNNFESSRSSKSSLSSLKEMKETTGTQTDLLNFITNVLSIPITTNSNKSISLLRSTDTILKLKTDVSTFAFNLNEEKKIDVFKQGYNFAMEFFNS